MKILLISSSPRKEKSQTLLLSKEVLKGCGGAASEIVHLRDLKIDFCRHCETCHRKVLACPIKDDVSELLNKMLEADGIILASPNYINQVNASLKAVFDRSSHFLHCFRLEGKYVAGVVTSGSGYDKNVTDYIGYYARACGAQYVGSTSCRAPVSAEARQEAQQLGRKLFAAIKGKKKIPGESKYVEERKAHFVKLVELRKDAWPGEYQYCKAKGWL